MVAAFGPGLMVPVTFLPSQSRATVTWRESPVAGRQSPVHVPVSGWPSCANAGDTHRHAAIANDVRSRRGAEFTEVSLRLNEGEQGDARGVGAQGPAAHPDPLETMGFEQVQLEVIPAAFGADRQQEALAVRPARRFCA